MKTISVVLLIMLCCFSASAYDLCEKEISNATDESILRTMEACKEEYAKGRDENDVRKMLFCKAEYSVLSKELKNRRENPDLISAYRDR